VAFTAQTAGQSLCFCESSKIVGSSAHKESVQPNAGRANIFVSTTGRSVLGRRRGVQVAKLQTNLGYKYRRIIWPAS